ncbi:phosphonate C-P lyase system protein PhnG [Halarchaeum nitratireducens]|uniref:Phosphonate C-P lyase system protein PhnG n=1 Tax=Halarchaeum nitratireducens TaxID=489913 RepID=A0A830GEL9_9EURY|nr:MULTISPECIES: phosphonate C-P lyase system protein PhnG [Halarchaeum]MBP2250990.1 alpha-D-ribose 1-methylphosphonate 5-triphosphate synthase subunit PhnG [Halarchaeum solikamskense]GGN21510.1 hypothetical protein GCM10009021_23550 [Halarchaeum nitratireducens]
MDTADDRTERFERIASTEADVLGDLADDVLASDPSFTVLQEPNPQLLMQRVREPVEHRPFNLGEVVVTPAEVEVNGGRGFAMYPGKAERAALSGAIVDAAVDAGHPVTGRIREELAAAAERRRSDRNHEWAESQYTAVDFETMEDDL